MIMRFVHLAGAKQVFRRQDLCGRAMGNLAARQQQRIREMRAHGIMVMQNCQYGAPFAMPAAHKINQISGSALVNGCKGFVQQNQIGILQ